MTESTWEWKEWDGNTRCKSVFEAIEDLGIETDSSNISDNLGWVPLSYPNQKYFGQQRSMQT